MRDDLKKALIYIKSYCAQRYHEECYGCKMRNKTGFCTMMDERNKVPCEWDIKEKYHR